MGSAAETIGRYEEIGSTTALSDFESARLQRAIRGAGERKGQKPWLPKDDRALVRGILQRQGVPRIAAILGRTERAVWRRIQKLREAGKVGYIGGACYERLRRASVQQGEGV